MAYFSQSEKMVQELLSIADIKINGGRSFDINVHDQRFFDRVLSQGSLGLGEAYMDEWWSCRAIDELMYKLLSSKLENQVRKNLRFQFGSMLALFFNMQTKQRSHRVAHVHYDLDNELYRHMLGSSMSYTCAYWKQANTLDQAQQNKYHLICRKLNLKAGDKVLELGCGWGTFAKFAATHYDCELVSVNISKQQVTYAKEICKGLPIEVYLCDYRDMNVYNPNHIQFDKIVSIGMCEHVGFKNYKTLMKIANANIKNHGLFLLHTIGANRFSAQCEPWLGKYIFPGGVVPSIWGLGKAMENEFIMEDWHNFGNYYDHTLMAWHQNFSTYWDLLKERFDNRFYRMWVYYLLSSAGAFRARSSQLWQIVLSKNGVPGGYESVR